MYEQLQEVLNKYVCIDISNIIIEYNDDIIMIKQMMLEELKSVICCIDICVNLGQFNDNYTFFW